MCVVEILDVLSLIITLNYLKKFIPGVCTEQELSLTQRGAHIVAVTLYIVKRMFVFKEVTVFSYKAAARCFMCLERGNCSIFY